MKAFIAASCHGVVLWFFQHRRVVIDPRFSFCHLALTENLCHFHTLVPVTRVLMTFLSLSGHRHLLRNVIRTAVSCDCASYS